MSHDARGGAAGAGSLGGGGRFSTLDLRDERGTLGPPKVQLKVRRAASEVTIVVSL